MSPYWRAGLLGGTALAIPAALNAAIARQRRELKNFLPGDTGDYAWPLGTIAYQVRGEGDPLVLVHGIGAGSSSYEFRHNFEALSEHFKVYALDLPGFGRSARADIDYSADFYITALMDFLRDVVRAPSAVIASSLSAAFTVKLAAQSPALITRLVLSCPTGLETLNRRIPIAGPVTYGMFSLPVVGTTLYNAITSYRSITQYMMENLYVDPTRVTPALVEHYYQSAHQPNAQYALRSFLSGLLNCSITQEWPRLTQQTLIVWGRYAKPTPAENAQLFLKLNPNTRLRVFERSGLLPHDEEHEDFNAAVSLFLNLKEASDLIGSTV